MIIVSSCPQPPLGAPCLRNRRRPYLPVRSLPARPGAVRVLPADVRLPGTRPDRAVGPAHADRQDGHGVAGDGAPGGGRRHGDGRRCGRGRAGGRCGHWHEVLSAQAGMAAAVVTALLTGWSCPRNCWPKLTQVIAHDVMRQAHRACGGSSITAANQSRLAPQCPHASSQATPPPRHPNGGV